MKYYGTLFNYYIPKEILSKYNARNNHNQYRLVCKAKSKAEANRIMQSILGEYYKPFASNQTSETGNATEIEMCNKYGSIIKLDSGYSTEFYSLSEIVAEANELKKTL